jgi:hypothetical protein
MTLEEKFEDVALVYGKSLNIVKTNVSIAEDFAIGFAQWLMKTRFKSIENIPVEKLLEIYKQQQL